MSDAPEKVIFNLVEKDWIPVIGADGVRRTLSLREVFASACDLRELAVQPHEKIALLRLLICITQAALDGPEDRDAWEACRENIPGRAEDYLEKWQAAFELFGNGPRFLQVPGLKADKEEHEGNPATKLDLMLASGNTASVFDNAAAPLRSVGLPRLALTLLTFQCFSPGGRIGVTQWQGIETTGKGSSNHAPCIPSGMLHTFLHGGNLLDMLHLNLLNKDDAENLPGSGWGKPVWEMPVTGPGDKTAISNATTTYLGRLVPLSRAVRLDPGGRTIVLANGLDYPLFPVFREPAATVVPRKEGPGIMGVSLGRGLWRQLSAITVKRHHGADQLNGPWALNHLGDDRGATLWIGAMATDKAKIEDLVEAAYDVPAGMFRHTGRKHYEAGVAFADHWQQAVSASIKAYAATLKLEPPPYERARQHFWTLVEQHVPALLRLAGDPLNAGDLPTSDWGRQVQRAAQAAYDFACPHQSPRQIEAFAVGAQQLYMRKPQDPSKPPKKSARLQAA